MLKKARVGLYPEEWIDKIPSVFKSKYCLKGKGIHEGQFLIDRGLMSNISFKTANLLEANFDLGLFNVIFLRNVLMYFDIQTKQKVVDNAIDRLIVGGYFIISLTENLNMIDTPRLKQINTSVYQRVA